MDTSAALHQIYIYIYICIYTCTCLVGSRVPDWVVRALVHVGGVKRTRKMSGDDLMEYGQAPGD